VTPSSDEDRCAGSVQPSVATVTAAISCMLSAETTADQRHSPTAAAAAAAAAVDGDNDDDVDDVWRDEDSRMTRMVGSRIVRSWADCQASLGSRAFTDNTSHPREQTLLHSFLTVTAMTTISIRLPV